MDHRKLTRARRWRWPAASSAAASRHLASSPCIWLVSSDCMQLIEKHIYVQVNVFFGLILHISLKFTPVRDTGVLKRTTLSVPHRHCSDLATPLTLINYLQALQRSLTHRRRGWVSRCECHWPVSSVACYLPCCWGLL